MKVPDWLSGSLLLLLALLVLWQVRGFPDIPGQAYGAGLFPALAAIGLALASLLLIGTSLRRRAGSGERAEGPASAGSPDGDGLAAGEALPSLTGRRLLALLLSVAVVVFYILAAPKLGFLVAGTVLLAVMLWAYGTRPALILPVAMLAALLIHGLFYKLLKVPLPWGLLQPIAW